MPSHYLSNPNFRTRIADQRARDDALIFPQVFSVGNTPAPYLPPVQLPGQGLSAPLPQVGTGIAGGDGGADPADSLTFSKEAEWSDLGNTLANANPIGAFVGALANAIVSTELDQQVPANISVANAVSTAINGSEEGVSTGAPTSPATGRPGGVGANNVGGGFAGPGDGLGGLQGPATGAGRGVNPGGRGGGGGEGK